MSKKVLKLWVCRLFFEYPAGWISMAKGVPSLMEESVNGVGTTVTVDCMTVDVREPLEVAV